MTLALTEFGICSTYQTPKTAAWTVLRFACVKQCLTSHLREPQLEYESAHLRDARRPLLEALQVVRGQDEESLLPTGEHLVPLLPEQPLPQRRRVPQAAERDGRCSSLKISHFIQQIPRENVRRI